MVVVAQLVRALVCGTKGRRFEPGLPPLKADSRLDLLFYCPLFSLLPYHHSSSFPAHWSVYLSCDDNIKPVNDILDLWQRSMKVILR